MGLQSKHFLTIANVVSLVLSIPILASGIWLSAQHRSDCYQFLHGPVIALGLFILLVSALGLLGALRSSPWILCIYLLAMAILILLLLCFTAFAFAVTDGGAGEALSGKGFKDYRLGDYSTWLRRKVRSSENWKKIRSCLQDAQVCRSLEVYQLATDFNKAHLDPLQSGCCKPPTICNFLFLNATYWTRPISQDADPDCYVYDYHQTELCFSCDSCKAGVLAKIKHDWRKVAVVNIIMFLFLTLIFAVACHTFYKAHKEGHYSGYSKEAM